MDKNKVMLRGVVQKVTTVEQKKTSVIISTLNATPKVNYPEVLFLGDNIEIGAKLQRGDHVTIECHVQSFKRQNEGHNFVIQKLVADNVKRTSYIMEDMFNVKDGRYQPPINMVALEGSLIYIKKVTDTLVNLIIGVTVNGYFNKVKVCYYLPVEKIDKFLNSVYAGAPICVTGSYQTSYKKNQVGQMARYENIVVDMVHIGDKEEKMPSESADIDVSPQAVEVKQVSTPATNVIHVVG